MTGGMSGSDRPADGGGALVTGALGFVGLHLARGLNVHRGRITHPAVATALDQEPADPFGAWA